ncbi:substrate-binding periplasmic protein [Chitinibacter sp. S2-10]|uniref:substrate-binding periplasmic protein n=1 Tax=Chitinibacter sp. S2-10 TaxID=3373597 RepID=UPI0039775E25
MRILACIGMLLSAFTLADVQLVVGEVPGHASMTEAGMKGADYDLVMEMAKRVGYKGKIEIQPYPRALKSGSEGSSVLVFPVARNPEREQKFKWITELTEDEIIVVANRNSTFDISSLEAVKNLRIGVLRSAVGDIVASKQAFPGIERVAKEEFNAKKLSHGRIDVWIGVWNAILIAQRNAGLSRKDLRRGVVIHRATAQLAASPDFSDAEAKKWQDALKAMKADGTYKRIIDANQYEFPPVTPPSR